jgi:hypothetical protein
LELKSGALVVEATPDDFAVALQIFAVLLPNYKHGDLRFRALLSESGVDRLELARSLP